MILREIHDHLDLGFSDVPGKHPTYTDTLLVYVQHDLHRLFSGFVKEPFQDYDYELHRRVVIVQQQHLVKAGLFESGFALLQCNIVIPAVLLFLTHGDPDTQRPKLMTIPFILRFPREISSVSAT